MDPNYPKAVMAGLGPANPRKLQCTMARAFVTNKPNGTLYVGVTNDIARRAHEHREGFLPGFTKRYGLKRLVYVEPFESIVEAIQREKAIKHWPRAWKVRLVLATNPTWNDLYDNRAFGT